MGHVVFAERRVSIRPGELSSLRLEQARRDLLSVTSVVEVRSPPPPPTYLVEEGGADTAEYRAHRVREHGIAELQEPED